MPVSNSEDEASSLRLGGLRGRWGPEACGAAAIGGSKAAGGGRRQPGTMGRKRAKRRLGRLRNWAKVLQNN
jgi:hypothetical protein